MLKTAAAMGTWWLAASSRQRACACITSCSEFLEKHQITQVTQFPYSPDLASYNFWLFPKLRSSLKGKRFQTIDEIQENTRVQLMEIGRTMWGPTVACFEGDWGIIVLCTMFLYLVSSSINVSFFPITQLATFWTDLIYTYYLLSFNFSN